MQRRPSHPHGQLTGMIVIILLMASVGIMFWVPSTGPAPSFDPVSAQAAGTPTLPIVVTRTPRPDPNAPVAQGEQASPIPTMDWSVVPTPIPADDQVAAILAQTAAAIPPPAPVIAYQPPPVYVQSEPQIVYTQPEIIYQTQEPLVVLEPGQRAVQTATPIVIVTYPTPEPAFGSKEAPDRAAEYAAATAQP